MAKQLYGRDLVDKVADTLHRFRCSKGAHAKDCECAKYTAGIYEAEAESVLEALTDTFSTVRLKGYQKGFEDALSEPPF